MNETTRQNNLINLNWTHNTLVHTVWLRCRFVWIYLLISVDQLFWIVSRDCKNADILRFIYTKNQMLTGFLVVQFILASICEQLYNTTDSSECGAKISLKSKKKYIYWKYDMPFFALARTLNWYLCLLLRS